MTEDVRPRGRLASRVAMGTALLVALAACSGTATRPPATADPAARTGVARSASATAPTPSQAGQTEPAPRASVAASASPVVASGPAPAVQVSRVASIPGSLAIANARDGSGRLFVASQSGQLWIVTDGVRSTAPILDLAGRITSGGERGLLGIAFHPRFPADPRLFVDYTDTSGNTVVASFTVADEGRGAVDAGSERVILRQPQPFANHNGGAIAFGPDGFLYIGLGDGGGGGDPQGNGQRLDTLLAKILRIDIDSPTGGNGYGIPVGNPFASRSGARQEVWLTGLRNPWRFSFDRSSGDLWIGDVGQNAWEEVDVAPTGVGGLNFGWNRMEGFHCFSPAQGCDTAGLTLPVAEYAHGPRCSISGGHVYRGAAFPMLQGRYLFGDYCTGEVLSIVAGGEGRREPQVIGTSTQGLSAFGEDEAGELYVTNVREGWLGRIGVAIP